MTTLDGKQYLTVEYELNDLDYRFTPQPKNYNLVSCV